MAGSWDSGEKIEAGRDNWSVDETHLWARRTDSMDGDDYNGAAILVVEVARHVKYPGDDDDDRIDDFLGSDFLPQHTVDAIVGSGWSGGFRTIGGVGVTGNGGRNQGTGVLGRGGGKEGTGGIGVHGIGGSQSEPTWDPTEPPGTGVLGQGGRQTKFNGLRLPHGAGVVGLAGGSTKPIPPLADTGSVGVYGQGAEAEMFKIPIGVDPKTGEPVYTVTGPEAPGPGVLGRGGESNLPNNEVAAGVIGLAGGVAIPPSSETLDKGVFGKGSTGVFGDGSAYGVFGQSEKGTGVWGSSKAGPGVVGFATERSGRGGIFQTTSSAQVLLAPQSQRGIFRRTGSVTPVEISPEQEGPNLPKDGQGGDLMTIADSSDQCTLWFCVKGASGGDPALWMQVLLGSEFKGQV